MASRCMSDRVILLLTLTVLLMFVNSTANTKQAERDGYIIKNVGIKLCQLKCGEHGQCVSIEYDIETLTCRLLRAESKIKKKEGHAILARSHSHVPTGSCTSSMCSSDQRCLKTRSGKEVCVQASTDPSSNTVPPAPVRTQDLQGSTIEAIEDRTTCTMVPRASVKTQDSDTHATPTQATCQDLFSACENGDLERVKKILSSGHVDINTRGEFGVTPVMRAAVRGHKDVVEFLVGRGADLSLLDNEDANVLHYAGWGGDMETVKLILSLNVLDVNARDEEGNTAAGVAREWDYMQVADFLESYSTD